MFFVCISFLLGVLFRWLGSELLRLLPFKEKGKKFLGYISCLDIRERFLTVGSTTQGSTLPVTETHAPSYSSAENGLTGLIEKRVSEVFSFLSESCDVLEGVRVTGWLGKGTFSNVYKALWGTSEAALKVCQTTGETNLKQMLAMEVAVSFCSRHPNIVTSYKYAVHQKRDLQASAEPLDAPSGSCAQSDQAASQASAGHWSLASLGQRNVLEVQLLQECCDIGTLRSAIRKGFLHRVGEACTCEGGGGAASAEAETLGSPESIALLQMGRVPTAWKLGDGRDSAMCTAFERTVPGDRSLVGKPPPGGSEEQQQKLRASSMPRDNHQDMGMVLSIASDVVEGMIYLHSHGIVHGDIKSSNILLKTVTVDGEQRACAKISDFGTSVLLRGGEELTEFFAGTPSYMAPEVISRSTVSQVRPLLQLSGTNGAAPCLGSVSPKCLTPPQSILHPGRSALTSPGMACSKVSCYTPPRVLPPPWRPPPSSFLCPPFRPLRSSAPC
uniref:Protein kinase domain-containing protein n=1 Tax=Tetraselmis sp. GSL018 TaxID=582737 RepID=A0A061S6X1_9CHLO